MEGSVFTSLYVALGVIVGLVIAVVIIKICNTNGKFKTDYDERQKIMIGKSYKCAMITTWVLMGIYIIIDLGGFTLPMENSLTIFSILFVSLIVHMSYSVWTDAYFGKNNNNGKYLVCFVVITLINIAVTVGYIMKGVLVVDGILTYRAINLECALAFMIMGIEALIKIIIDKKNSTEEDDDEES